MKKTEKTIVTAQQLAEMRGYSDIDKLIEEADRADLVSEIAGTPHIYVEDWDEYLQKSAASQLSARASTGKTLADTDQLGIINSNLKRLPASIQSKERKLRSLEALLKSASTDDERYRIRGEIGRLREELQRHRENLKMAQERQKEILAKRAAELDALEAEDRESSKGASVADAEPSEE